MSKIYIVKVDSLAGDIEKSEKQFTSIAEANKAIRKLAAIFNKRNDVIVSSAIWNNKAYEFSTSGDRKLVGIATRQEASPIVMSLQIR